MRRRRGRSEDQEFEQRLAVLEQDPTLASAKVKAVIPKHNLNAAVAPGVTDDVSKGYTVGSIWVDRVADAAYMCLDATIATANWTVITGTGAGGAPINADYLVGTANATLTAEIVVGTTPGGELGGTWGSPTVDASHSGSTHAATQAAAEATAAAALTAHEGAADPHTGYQKESEKDAASGYAGLDASSRVTKSTLIDAMPDSDHTAGAGSRVITLTAGAALAFGDACYVGSDSKMEKTDADAEATSRCFVLCLETIAEDASGLFLRDGTVGDDTWNWTPGGYIYLDTATAGGLTQTAPSGTDDCVVRVGLALTADVIYFSPPVGILEHT